jgi:hypothetical protein
VSRDVLCRHAAWHIPCGITTRPRRTTARKLSTQEVAMSYSATWAKPILHLGDGDEGQQMRAMLEEYGIDFQVDEAGAPRPSIEWNGIVYQGLYGLADFLTFVGRHSIPGIHRTEDAVDRKATGTRIEIPPERETRG